MGGDSRYQQQQCIHPVLVPRLGQLQEAVGRSVGPKIVAVDAEEIVFPDQRLGLHQAAAGFHQLGPLVGNADCNRIGQGGKMFFQHVCHIMHVNDCLGYFRFGKLVEAMVDHRLAGNLDQRFRPGIGQRTHAITQSRRHDHRGLYSCHRAAFAAGIGRPRTSAGMFRSNHFVIGASAGCCRSFSSRRHIRGRKSR